MDCDIENILERLNHSKFRAGRRLKQKEKDYYQNKGEEVIRRHARDFISSRLAPAQPKNDTKQTPFHGHPVFVAQHATATCCRKCLAKWHGIEKGRELTDQEAEYVAEVIMTWIRRCNNDC